MEKNNKETKKADFIDLDKSQFKKKPSIFHYCHHLLIFYKREVSRFY